MNIILIILYIIFAVGGSTLIKYGGLEKSASLLQLPVVNVSLSLVSLIGIACYGFSFVVYVLLLNKLDLSFLSPVTIGLVYILLMITAVIVFGEHFTPMKSLGCALILVGVLLVVFNR